MGAPARAQDPVRFLYMGDGSLVLNGQTVTFRAADGTYSEAGLKTVHRLFNANWQDPEERLSLRFLEMLDYLQDQLKAGSYTLKSGYRSPGLNQSLRNKGKLAAQSSMHIEGAAADLVLAGVPASQVFDFVKAMNCCGIGWYHGKHFHIDTGPARYWDESSSKTEDKSPQQNEKLILQPDWDRYRPGETVDLKWMRVTEYPIGIPAAFVLTKEGDPSFKKELPVVFGAEPGTEGDCRILPGRKVARQLKVRLPDKGLSPGIYALQVRFCNRYAYEKMPEEIVSKSFEIK